MSTRPPSTPPTSGPSFRELGLPPATLANLDQLGYVAMTPIQAASLPLALAGHDLVAQAKTGSGKTAAFGLVLLANLKPDVRGVQALVLCPTRELAEQVSTELRRLARASENVKVLVLTGGAPIRPQLSSLEHGAHVVVGTPGRVLDHLSRKSLDLGALATLVLDEADRMLDMGFLNDVLDVVERCPKTRQTLLFSATYPDGVIELGRRFLRAPKEVKLLEQHAPTKIRQRFYAVDDRERLDVVVRLLEHYRPERTLAFCNTKDVCRGLAQKLAARGIEALALHGDLEQRERDQVLVQFVNRSCSVLVATDVAARGLDIAELDAVVNVEVSPDPEVHVHRIGRTGRVDREGSAFTLASERERARVARIEEARGTPLEWGETKELVRANKAPLVPPMTTIQILGGRKEKLRAGDVLGALTRGAGLPAEHVGKITVNAYATYVAVDRRSVKAALRELATKGVKGRAVKARTLPADDA
ncbi:MAG: ATP-dependent RNA helicase DbpA [Planctomycetota bacterium]